MAAGALVLIGGAIFRNWPVLLAAIGGAVALWYTVAASFGLRDFASSDGVRIVPYFERKVPGVDTFFRSGGALARNCAYLDATAIQAGLIPLSTFGFADDFWGRRIPWYDADEGLATVGGLLSLLAEQPPEFVPEPEAVIADLERLRSRLEEARRLQVRFCLHLRQDLAYSGEEFARRRGKY